MARSLAIMMLMMFMGIPSSAECVSFDCSKATKFVERTICSNNALSELDDSLSKSYHKAIQDSANPEVIKRRQRAWIKNDRNACGNIECIRSAYVNRLSEINGMTNPNSRQSSGGSIPKKVDMPSKTSKLSSPKVATKEGGGSDQDAAEVASARLAYYKEIQNIIYRNWHLPESLASQGFEAHIVLLLRRDGKVLDVSFEKRSSEPQFDKSVESAVRKSDPLPAYPKIYSPEKEQIGIRFRPENATKTASKGNTTSSNVGSAEQVKNPSKVSLVDDVIKEPSRRALFDINDIDMWFIKDAIAQSIYENMNYWYRSTDIPLIPPTIKYFTYFSHDPYLVLRDILSYRDRYSEYAVNGVYTINAGGSFYTTLTYDQIGPFMLTHILNTYYGGNIKYSTSDTYSCNRNIIRIIRTLIDMETQYAADTDRLSRDRIGIANLLDHNAMNCSEHNFKINNDKLKAFLDDCIAHIRKVFEEIKQNAEEAKDLMAKKAMEEESRKSAQMLIGRARAIEEERQKSERIDKLRTGQVQPVFFEDYADQLITTKSVVYLCNPPVDGPKEKGQYYNFRCKLKQKLDGNIYVCHAETSRDAPPCQITFSTPIKTFGELLLNKDCVIIGKYNRNIELKMVVGTKVIVPLLEECYVKGQ